MPTRFRAYQPDQILLMPPKVRDWVPEGHLAQQVSDVVDSLDLSAFYAPYEGDGRRNAPYSPTMMVKVLIYGYATGVFSSRGIARKLEEDVAFRMLAAGNFPKHRTICEFRHRHLSDFRAMFLEVVRVSREMGLVRFGTLSIDGTKVRANASKRKAMSYDRMLQEEARLEEEIAGLLSAATQTDEEEDRRFGKGDRGDELPEELRRREQRLLAIREAKERLEAAQRRADDDRGRTPGSGRSSGGRKPYKRSYGEPDAKAAEQLHGSGEPDHEDERGGVPAVLQRPDGGGRREADGGGDGGRIGSERPGADASFAGRGGGGLRRDAGGGAGGCGLLQRGGPLGT